MDKDKDNMATHLRAIRLRVIHRKATHRKVIHLRVAMVTPLRHLQVTRKPMVHMVAHKVVPMELVELVRIYPQLTSEWFLCVLIKVDKLWFDHGLLAHCKSCLVRIQCEHMQVCDLQHHECFWGFYGFSDIENSQWRMYLFRRLCVIFKSILFLQGEW